jgi:dTDP-4-dehydrorhamnose reductase
MRIVVTGRTGQVARSLIERAGDMEVIALGRPEFDLARPSNLHGLLRAAAPDVVVSAAAYTNVDKAESEPELAFAVNRDGAGAVAEAAARLGVPIIHLSTDYVFDGAKSSPYLEDDVAHPLGVYGASKLAGEEAVRTAAPDHVILRTAWVYSPFGSNFLMTMLRLAEDRPELRIVADQIGSPTSALDIADGILAIARNLLRKPEDTRLRGSFHMVAAGQASWAGFAQEILRLSRNLGGPTATVRSISAADYPTAARRPANSCLSTARLALVHGVRLPDWRPSTALVVQRLLAAASAKIHEEI